MTTLEALSAAMTDGRPIGITYAASSQPGRWRQILPQSITRSVCKARCLATGELRTFKLEHITVVDLDPALVPEALKYSVMKPGKEVAA